jgi:hypothetical protein
VNDVLAAVRAILEPEPVVVASQSGTGQLGTSASRLGSIALGQGIGAPQTAVRDVAIDETYAKPLAFRAETLYVWAETVTDVPLESGPTAREDFDLRVLLTGPEAGEEASSQRSAEVSEWLDGKREVYMAAVRANGRTTDWGHLRASATPGPANLQLRSLALRLSGYRIV